MSKYRDGGPTSRLLLSLYAAHYAYPQAGATRSKMPAAYDIDQHSAIIEAKPRRAIVGNIA